MTKKPVADSEALSITAAALVRHVADAVVAREQVIKYSIVSLLAGGHLLINDLPGVGKTLLARSLASAIGGSFKRIQFTSDLLPTDITGSSIFHQGDGRLEFVPGPIFANIVLADEINRASTRTQSALLEAMSEEQVTADGRTYPLPQPFWVIATQNDVDSYGTYPLPQGQLDRFMMSLSIGYPSAQEEVSILRRNQRGDPILEPMLDTERVRALQLQVREVEVATSVREYMGNVLAATRDHAFTSLGASPRAGVHLQRSSQALAALQGSPFVAPEHVKAVAPYVLSHRLLLVPNSPLSSHELINNILDCIPVPV